MCVAPAIITAIATATSGYLAYEQAKQSQDAARENARIQMDNARRLRRQKRQVEKDTTLQKSNLSKQVTRLSGVQMVALASGGVKIGQGSAAHIVENTRILEQQTLNNMDENAKTKISNIELQAQEFEKRANRYKNISSQINPFGSAIIGAASGGLNVYSGLSNTSQNIVRDSFNDLNPFKKINFTNPLFLK